MTKPIRILLQTTIPAIEDDWNIERFSFIRCATRMRNTSPTYVVDCRALRSSKIRFQFPELTPTRTNMARMDS